MIINNNLYIDLIELKKIIKTLHALTGLTIGVLSADGDVVCGYPAELASFCQKVRNFHGKDNCLDCDKAGVNRCKETAAP